MKREKNLQIIIIAIIISGTVFTLAVNRYVKNEIKKKLQAQAVELEKSYGKYEAYLNSFAELEEYFKDSKANEAATQKETAASEFQKWNIKLKELYKDIVSGLSDAEAKALEAEQNEWKKQRDIDALDAALRIRGTSDSVEYIKSQTESTKIRAYELLIRYKELLEAEVQLR